MLIWIPIQGRKLHSITALTIIIILISIIMLLIKNRNKTNKPKRKTRLCNVRKAQDTTSEVVEKVIVMKQWNNASEAVMKKDKDRSSVEQSSDDVTRRKLPAVINAKRQKKVSATRDSADGESRINYYKTRSAALWA